ncbi:MAG: hypothetical protein JST92_27215, partial [Deltaproteobacteria bacterium]|nr:hypothetical protein [Deltaproteobacteria bacterium]
MHRSIAPLLAASSLFATAASAVAPPEAPVIPSAAELKAQNAKFAPVELKVDLAKLPANEKAALNEIIEAARIMDGIFLRQTWSGSPAMLSDLARDDSPLGRARLDAFLINQGPWLRIDHDKAFMPGVGAKPEQGNFYPRVTKDVIETWHKSLSAEQKERATGFFTTIRREGDKFLIVPYSTEYQGELADAAMHLTAAAALTTQPTLKKFLETRAAAFLSNDYYASDVAWMELDASIEPTIGPYEVYEDNWFNAKAAFESFIGLRDDAESQKLAKLADELQGLENALPLDAALKN